MSTPAPEEKILIYWLSQIDSEILYEIGEPRLNALPAYINDQISARYGRPGRGRLWVDQSIELTGIDLDDTKPLAKHAAHCGGIAIKAADLPALAGLPGFATDLTLNPVD